MIFLEDAKKDDKGNFLGLSFEPELDESVSASSKKAMSFGSVDIAAISFNFLWEV